MMRRFNISVLSGLATGLMALAAASPAAAADSKEVRVISVPSPTGAAAPDASYAGLDETNVTVGPETSGVPCGECVPGAGGNNIGLPWPLFAIPAGTTMTISTWFQSVSYTGPCTAGLILKQGPNVIYTNSYNFQGGCNAGFLYGVFFTVPAPATTGFTTVIGTITGGVNKSGADTFINIQ